MSSLSIFLSIHLALGPDVCKVYLIQQKRGMRLKLSQYDVEVIIEKCVTQKISLFVNGGWDADKR